MNSNPNQYSKGSYGTMFKSNNNYGGMSETNPGGNPFRQGGNKAGVSMAFNNKVYNGKFRHKLLTNCKPITIGIILDSWING